MKPVLVLWSCVVVLMTLAVARAGGEPDPRAALAKRVFRNAQGESLPYRLFVPRKYDPAKRFPILLFLHGAGERGSDNEAQLKHAEVLRFIREDVAAKEPCFLVAPQCPAEDTWAGLRLGGPYTAAAEPAKPLRLTMELLDSLDKEFSIDPDRRYVTGLSMGGFGSFDLCLRRPGSNCGGHSHLRRRRREPGQDDRPHRVLGLPRRRRQRRRSEVFPGHGRSPETAGCTRQIHRVSRRRPQLLDSGLPGARIGRLALQPAPAAEAVARG